MFHMVNFCSCCSQDLNNEVRQMGEHLSNIFENKYADFLRQQEEERVRVGVLWLRICVRINVSNVSQVTSRWGQIVGVVVAGGRAASG